MQWTEILVTFHITEITGSIESSASPGPISRRSWNFSSERLEYTAQIFRGELHMFLPCVLHVTMSMREWKVFCQYFCFIWLHFWMLCYRREKLVITYLQPWVGIPSWQCCIYTRHTVLFFSWSGKCFTCVLGLWRHLMEKWPHVKAAGGKGCFQQVFLEGEPLGRLFSSYVPSWEASLLCWDLSAVP